MSRADCRARGPRGPFRSLEDLCRRTDLQKAQQADARGADPVGQSRLARRQPCDAHARPALGHAAGRSERARERGGTGRLLRSRRRPARPRRRRSRALPSSRSGARRCACRASATRWASISPDIRSPASKAISPRFVSHRINDVVNEKPMVNAGYGFGKLISVAGLIDEVRKRGPRTILILDDSHRPAGGHGVR